MVKNKQIISTISDEKKSKYNIIYADIESIIINDTHYPYAIGWSKNKKYTNIITSDKKKIMNYFIIEKFLKSINPNEKTIIYFHNMSNFDGFLILHKILKYNINVKLIEKNNIIYNICINNNINIRDSYLFIPISLKEIGLKICKDNKKLDFNIETINIENIEKNTNIIDKYLEKDVRTLEEGFEIFKKLIFNKFNYDITKSMSLSSVAFNIFRKNFYDINKYPIYKNDRKIDQFIRESYIGGITDVYKPTMINGYSYDINSLSLVSSHALSSCDKSDILPTVLSLSNSMTLSITCISSLENKLKS